MHQPAHLVEVGQHARGIHDELVHQPGEADQREIQRYRRVGTDHPLHRGVADIAFVPERDVLERRSNIAADQPGQAGEILAEHRVALVRHCARPLLARRKELLRFEHLGTLKMADLGRQPFDAAGNDAQRREIHCVAIARDDLRADRLDREVHRLRNVRLDVRLDIGEGADRARDRAGGDFGACGNQPRPAARELGIGLRQLQSKRRRLGVDAVAPADRRRVLVFARTAFEHHEQRVDVGQHQVGSARQLHAKTGIEHVRAGHALVDEARRLADMLCKVGQESDDVVLGLALDHVDAVDLEFALRPHRRRRLARDHPQFGQRVHRVRLDLEPDSKARLRLPDHHHFGTRIARDHAGSPLYRGCCA